ncbi:hypothetical protein PTTG_26701 [Puccinia triticina 1-1 BBBD Race 1]|uniref:Uncharacterized protein n=1 Tax=Puccinia triticina (isolate 1-1 / race 1 (BBBD)) TaxID=630390 RepID=A0A180GSJ7_PUCT1|nr:hypothetical protein PTTG_26701 [Puccinia triticina 1-1 BBBD Race 1]
MRSIMPFLTVLLSATVHLSVASPVVGGVVNLKASAGAKAHDPDLPACVFPQCK